MKRAILASLYFFVTIISFQSFGKIPTVPAHVTLKTYQMIKDIHDVFTLYDIPYWMHAGTLLGAVRHKGLIPWDDDADLIIEKKYQEKFEEIQDIFKTIGYGIKEVQYGYKIVLPQPKGAAIQVDIMIFIEKEDDKYIYEDRTNIYKHIYFNKADVFPLIKYQFGELELWGPHDPIPYLNLAYPDWNTHARVSNHFYFSYPKVALTPEHTVPGTPTGPLLDNVKQIMKRSVSQTLVIRPATYQDSAQLTELIRQLGFPEYQEETSILKLEEFSNNPHDKIWVASLNGSVVGLLALNIINPFYKEKLFARVDSIVVDERVRGLGIGTQLINHAEEYAQSIGCERIFLTSGNHRPDAHGFYTHLGYVNNATYFVKRFV